MHDEIELGSGPANERLAQVGSPDYPEQSRQECHRYKELLEKEFGPLRAELELNTYDAYFKVKTEWNHEDPRREVTVRFSTQNELAIGFAFFVENHSPINWNETVVYNLKDFEAWNNENKD